MDEAVTQAVVYWLMHGQTVRQVASLTRTSTVTVGEYRQVLLEQTKLPPCRCGKPNGHSGWCWFRLKNSPKRQALMARLHGKDKHPSTNVMRRETEFFDRIDSALKLIGMTKEFVYSLGIRSGQGGSSSKYGKTLDYHTGYAMVREQYRKAVKQHHPDKGGSVEQTTNINLAWQRVQTWFGRKGVAV